MREGKGGGGGVGDMCEADTACNEGVHADRGREGRRCRHHRTRHKKGSRYGNREVERETVTMRGKKNQSTAPKIKEFNVYTCSADAPPQRVCTCVSATRKCACVCKRDSLCVEERETRGTGGKERRTAMKRARPTHQSRGWAKSKAKACDCAQAKQNRGAQVVRR